MNIMFGFFKKFVKDPKKPVKPSWEGEKDLVNKSLGQAKSEVAKIVTDTVSFKGFLGEIKSMDERELAARKSQDEQSARAEAEKLKAQIRGRDVPGEIKEVIQEKERKKQEEEQYLAQIRRQRERENAERMQAVAEAPGNSKRPGKEAKKKGGGGGKKAKTTAAPSQEQLSSTGEFNQKPE